MKTEAKELLDKHQQGLCTEEEAAFVETWYLKQKVLNPVQLSEEERLADIYKIWNVLAEKTGEKSGTETDLKGYVNSYKLWYRIAAIASVILILGALIIFMNRGDERQYQHLDAKSDIPAGNNRAILTLANGKKINLTDAANGKLIEEAGMSITKTADGQVVYEMAPQTRNGGNEMAYNTISTPRGGQYQINLPDGSRVWLNAASSLKFPASFASLKERKVVLNGEAYFDVHHDSKKPFKVEATGQMVEDIGTQFNINSYSDELVVKTTLVEGSASVSSSRNNDLILQAGQQAVLSKSGIIKKQTADVQEAIAWKQGDFVFRNTDFKTVMRKIARWYDVEIVYDASAPSDIPLGGLVSRSKNISVLLNLMEETGAVHFNVEGRRITVSK
jgi:transmembrane sensor